MSRLKSFSPVIKNKETEEEIDSDLLNYYRTIKDTDKIPIFCFSRKNIGIYDKLLSNRTLKNPHIIISIRSPSAEEVKFPSKENIPSQKSIFAIARHDLTPNMIEQYPSKETCMAFKKYLPKHIFNKKDANNILEFVEKNYKKYGKGMSILVNCEAGISRSAGICKALDEIYNYESIFKYGETYKENDFFIPNMLWYNEIMKAFYKKHPEEPERDFSSIEDVEYFKKVKNLSENEDNKSNENENNENSDDGSFLSGISSKFGSAISSLFSRN